MSNSTKRALIRSSLTELFCEQTKAITFITSDGVDFHILDAFICPLCMNIINVEDKDKITLEDVPPESVGGKPILVTCADCNNTLGGRVDNYLYNELLVYHLLRHPENTSFKTTFVLNGIQIKGRMKLDLNSERPKVQCTIDANDRVNYPLFTKELETNWDGCNLQMHSDITSTKRIDEYSNISVLKSAFLLAFSKLGYMYILQDNLDNVRAQILNRDKNILGNHYLIGRGIDLMPEVNDGVYYGLVEKTHCVIVIMTLKLKKKNATSHRVIVALPHPYDKDGSLYGQIAKMDTAKMVSNLEEVVPLPIKPMQVDKELNDIFEDSQMIGQL